MTQPASSAPADFAVIASSIELVTEQGIVAKSVLLLPFGEFWGRDGRGPYVLRDRAHAEGVIAATRAFAGSADLLINYDHQSEFAARDGVGGQAKAAGWIAPSTLTVANDGIRGDVEWTKPAEAALAAREYRYHSPHFRVDKVSRRITRLVNAGLTNSPNLDLPALASQEPGNSTEESDDMTKIALAPLVSALALAATAGETEVLAAIDQLKSRADDGDKVLASTRTTLGLAQDADSEAVLAAVVLAMETGEPDPAKFVPIADLKDVQTRLASIEEEKVTAMVDQAIEGGKLTPGQKDWALRLGKKDVSELQSFLGTAPVFAAGAQVKGKPETEKGKLSEEEKAICAQQGLTEKEFLAARDGESIEEDA